MKSKAHDIFTQTPRQFLSSYTRGDHGKENLENEHRSVSSLTHYLPVSSYDDRGSKFKFYIKKGSMKKFPMSVATMRR